MLLEVKADTVHALRLNSYFSGANVKQKGAAAMWAVGSLACSLSMWVTLSQLSQVVKQTQKVRVDHRELERFEPLMVWHIVFVAHFINAQTVWGLCSYILYRSAHEFGWQFSFGLASILLTSKCTFATCSPATSRITSLNSQRCACHDLHIEVQGRRPPAACT